MSYNGYKAFRSIIQNINTNQRERISMETTHNNSLDKFARFLMDHPVVDGYMDDGSLKKTFASLGKKAFSDLAKFLGITEYKVDFNPAGPAGSGDLSLRGMMKPDKGIYLQLTRDGIGDQVLYRTISHLKDYTGGANHYFNISDLRDPERIRELIRSLIPPEKEKASNEHDPELERETFEIENMVHDKPVAEFNWQLSKADYMVAMSERRSGFPHLATKKDAEDHHQIVTRALALGFDVPDSVLQDYPELTGSPVNDKQVKPGKDNMVMKKNNLLIGDAWFKQHPEKILGEEYHTKDAFGKDVTRVRGKLEEAISKIPGGTEALNDKRIVIAGIPGGTDMPSALLNDPAKKANIERAVHQARKGFSEKALRKLTGEKEQYEEAFPEEYYCFDRVMKDYNQGISEDEIKAWIWYKRKNGGFNDEHVILNAKNGWAKYVVPLSAADKHLATWLKNGIVCYFHGGYLPSVLYYAENIYEKQSTLLSEKTYIIEHFGQAQFDRQWKGLEAVMPPKLTLTDPDPDKRLFIKPDSGFAQSVEISSLADGTDFTQYIRGKKNNAPGRENLVEAFKIWLDSIPANEFKKSTAWNIKRYYLDNATPSKTFDKEEKLRLKQNARAEGDRFFVRYLAEALVREDQLRIEQLWNGQYNAYVDINYLKIPVAFTCSSTFKNKPLFIRPAQREGLGFISVHGSGCVAYDVGLGKTMTAILALAQALEMGQCKRPFIVVPNQTYQNWLNEIRGVVDKGKVILSGLLPQYQVIDLYNLGTDYIEQLHDSKGNVQAVPEHTISVMTYEGFNRLGFKDDTWKEIGDELYAILNQGIDKNRDQQILRERIETMMGKGVKGGLVDIEDLGFDYMVVDEAHAMKKSFTQVKGEAQGDDQTRKRSTYEIHSGEPSMTALRGFMISQYILRRNSMRNVMLLTATPFTNSPLEIYSILALIGYQQLVKSGIRNIKSFFDTFIKSSLELVINAKLQPERKEVVLGFYNLIALQQLIFKFVDYKTGEDAGIQRPNKIVLPLTSEKVGNVVVPLPTERQVSTNLPMTQLQKDYMADVELYVTGKTNYTDFCLNPKGLIDDDPENSEGEKLDEANMSDEEQEGARVLRALSLARQLALSPYLYSCNPEKHPTYEQYINTSPKLKYVMECIRSVKHYHEEQGTDVSGQVIYMNAGVHYFPLIKEYLVREIGFRDAEVGIIKSGMSTAKKEGIKERFLAGGVKIIIGSASIKEGINLQNRATVLYNCWLDWNPTDEKQLEGRIWRFGNRYANVRIVHPLMEDSIDVFVFQKLQEKTSRINDIWFRSGKSNTLKLEEFNPGELKMGLVTNPHALANLILLEKREHIKDAITGLDNEKKIVEHIAEQRSVFNAGIGKITTLVNQYKPARDEETSRNTETIFRLFREYLDDEGSNYTYADKELYDRARKAYSVIKRATIEILEPRGMDINFDSAKLLRQFDKEIGGLKEEMETFTGEQAVNDKAQAIIKDRIARDYKPRSVSERVAEFSALNPGLLDELMIYDNSEESINLLKEKNQYGADMESSADALTELESLLKDMEEMEQLINELEVLSAA